MAETKKPTNIWYVKFPTYQYKEDVKELARKKGLKIIDARFQGKEEQHKEAPKLTLKDEYRPKEPEKTTPPAS